MPTYTVTTANLILTPAQENTIAAAITNAHHDNTGAPSFFAQVLFVALPERKHYIGGKLNTIPHIFVHGDPEFPQSAGTPRTGPERAARRAGIRRGTGRRAGILRPYHNRRGAPVSADGDLRVI
jgi:phenylpyruvate tautomerase PptA (4-oxalocrotonate tautomerase family)